MKNNFLGIALASFLVLLSFPAETQAQTACDDGTGNAGVCKFLGTECPGEKYYSGCGFISYCCLTAGVSSTGEIGAWQRGFAISKEASGLADRRADVAAQGVLKFLTGSLVVLSVGAFVVGGLWFILGSGDPNQIKTAVGIIKWSTVGLVTSLLSYTIVSQIDSILQGNWLENLLHDLVSDLF